MRSRPLKWTRPIRLVLATVVALGLAAGAAAQPSFSKVFVPDTIGPGSATALTFTITNLAGAPVTGLAFTDVLPAGVSIASPALASTTCAGGTLVAPDGGTTISLSGASLGSASTCLVVVHVTSSTPGVHTNVSGDLTSSAGNSGPAIDDLTVAIDRPGFSKSFAPSVVELGGRTTLIFTVDNTANASPASRLTFADPLPAGLTVASPSNASTTCAGGAITAVPGSSVVSYGPVLFQDASVAAGASCSVRVDVVASAVGLLANLSGDLSSVVGPTTRVSGRAIAGLTVPARQLSVRKEFVGDPVAPGGSATLRFTVTNLDRGATATDITFADDLDATLSGLAAVTPLPSQPCGVGSSLTGTDLLTLTGGTLGPDSSCTFDVTVQVPAAAQSGQYVNTTSAVTALLDGFLDTFPPASDLLVVSAAPSLVKEFVGDPVAAGGPVTLRFTLTNLDSTSTAFDIGFTDDLTAVIPGLAPASLPTAGFCGAGSTMTTRSGPFGELLLSMTGGELAAADSCTFDVALTVPAGAPGGTYLNTTSAVTAVVGEETLTGASATDTLLVVAAPRLTKSFVGGPATPGATTTLELVLVHGVNAPADAVSIAFTDDLDAALAGLVAVGLPQNDVCGPGSQISGTSVLTFTGGALAPGATCTIPITVQLPAGAPAGTYPNVTSSVTATVAGIPVTGAPATGDLTVAGLTLSKAFTDDPVVAGAPVTLSFTLTNASSVSSITAIGFTDNLGAVVPGLTAVGLPAVDVCGVGSQLVGTTVLTFSGGSLAPGATCTFDVTLQVPGGAASGEYPNVTSPVTATVDGSPAILPGATDTLSVTDALLFSKSFVDASAAPGTTTVLGFTVTNAHPTEAATALTFTDDLGAALSGLVAVGLPVADVCGAGSLITGASVVTLTGGTVPPGGSCTFPVTLQVPAVVPAGTVAVNISSPLSGLVGGTATSAPSATDSIRIESATLSKSFADDAAPGGTVTLTFTIDNPSTTSGLTDLAFSDDLGAVLPGLVAVGLPAADVCGPGSLQSGTTLLTLIGGSLPPSGSCSWAVTLQLPPNAAPGAYPNTTGDLTSGGLPVGSPATDTLTVVPPPAFSKSFLPGTVALGGVSTLTLSVDNSASSLAATDLDVTDNLPAGMTVASPSNAASTCSGGTLTAVSGTGVVTSTGGSVAAGASCTISVDVVGAAAGTLVNTTGDLTSSSGSSGTASAALTVVDAPFAVSKAFSATPVLRGGVIDLELTVTNLSPTESLTEIAFTDDLTAALPGLVATGLPANDVCGAGSSLSGAGVLSVSGGSLAPGASCTFTATLTVPPDAPLGPIMNTTSAASAEASGVTISAPPAAATFEVAFLVPSKAFASSAVPGGVVTLAFTVTNPDPVNAVTGIGFADDLEAVIPGLAALGLPAADVCGSGSQLTGTSVVVLSGGSLPPGGSCTFDVTVRVPATASAGSFPNVTSPLTAVVAATPVAGDATSVATADLVVSADPTAVPTLAGWGLLAFAALLAAAGWTLLRTRR